MGHAGCLQPHLVGDFACIVLDGELRQWHLGFGVERVGAVVVMALLQKCVVCGLRAGGGVRQWVGKGPRQPVPGLVTNCSALIGKENKSQLPLVAHCPGWRGLGGPL